VSARHVAVWLLFAIAILGLIWTAEGAPWPGAR
jgi:hypothetical protein